MVVQVEMRRRGSPLEQRAFHVQPYRSHQNRAASAVVAGIPDTLEIKGRPEIAPQLGSIVRLRNVLAAIAEMAVTQQKPGTAQLQVFPVVL
jgi:hypothetical protein